MFGSVFGVAETLLWKCWGFLLAGIHLLRWHFKSPLMFWNPFVPNCHSRKKHVLNLYPRQRIYTMAKVASTTPKKIPSIHKLTGATRNHIYEYVYEALLPSSPLGIATLNTHALSLDPLPIFKGQRDNHNCQHQWTKNNRLDWGIQPALANTNNPGKLLKQTFQWGLFSGKANKNNTHIP